MALMLLSHEEVKEKDESLRVEAVLAELEILLEMKGVGWNEITGRKIKPLGNREVERGHF